MHRFKLVPFSGMKPGLEQLYLVDELIPITGLVDVWGKSKCFKSFWTLDLMLHVAMGWEYRDRRVRQGTVVYCAFEGGHGYKKRIEAQRRYYKIPDDANVPLYVMSGQASLVKDHRRLIADVKAQLGAATPVAVVLDTLNRSIDGSESKDTDMGAYITAAGAIRDAFGCVVVIVHHCGLDETRPRGHTSLPGAVEAQLAVTREGMSVTVVVEMMRDGPEDTVVTSILESIEVGEDEAGKVLTSLVVVPGEEPAHRDHHRWTRSLIVFRKALMTALGSSGELIRELDNDYSPQVRAVDVEYVRMEFYAIYPAKGDSERQRQENRRRQFNRCVSQAQADNLIRVRVRAGDQTMIWPAAGTT
jgi:AAA domain